MLENSNLSALPLASEYRTGSSDPINDFYGPCLENSTFYKRAVGYFRSSIYLVIGKSIINFAKKGGKIQLICSPFLEQKDIEVINESYLERQAVQASGIIEQINSMLDDKELVYPTKVLATLVSLGILEIKIALRPQEHGLYHEKIGIFSDSYGNKVSFIGSANESWSGWHSKGNFESIEVFCNWHNASERDRVMRHESNFDRLWSGVDPEAKAISFPEAAIKHLCQQSYKSLDEAEIEIEKNFIASLVVEEKPKRTLMPHQSEAISKWKKCGRLGVFEHATGSGKTFTALEASREHLESGLPLLVLVPSRLLLKQWEQEVKGEYPDAAILLAGAGNLKWKANGKLSRFTSSIKSGPRVVISTMQTSASEAFRKALNQGEHLMVVADEAHQIGSHHNSKSLTILSGPRLGLSATPKRYGDPEGTQKIFDYFGPVIEPAFSLIDAVNAGRLVEYEYFPHPIHLTAEESDEWKKITKQISLELARTNFKDNKILSDKAKILILNRSRIAKKAKSKIKLSSKVISENYNEGQSWLIYCEDSDQLDMVMDELKSVGVSPIEYHSNMDGDRQATLDWFKRFGGVLVSIKCLDEGIDIPSISHALILASSQNPRQFIQRRGRVLRRSENKTLAVIHDAIVVPLDIDLDKDQISLLKSEFLRAIEFSNSAINKSSGAILREIARNMGFDAEMDLVDGVEVDDGNE